MADSPITAGQLRDYLHDNGWRKIAAGEADAWIYGQAPNATASNTLWLPARGDSNPTLVETAIARVADFEERPETDLRADLAADTAAPAPDAFTVPASYRELHANFTDAPITPQEVAWLAQQQAAKQKFIDDLNGQLQAAGTGTALSYQEVAALAADGTSGGQSRPPPAAMASAAFTTTTAAGLQSPTPAAGEIEPPRHLRETSHDTDTAISR